MFIPGTAITIGVLLGGFWGFYKGKDKATQQKFMRARVVAQGATLAALFYFSFLNPTEPISLEQKIINHHNSMGKRGNPLYQDKPVSSTPPSDAS